MTKPIAYQGDGEALQESDKYLLSLLRIHLDFVDSDYKLVEYQSKTHNIIQ